MIKPFLRWAGGKQNSVNLLLEHSPNHDIINKYFEPFLGAGSLFFANGFDNAFISDINPQLINSYRMLQSDYKKVHELLAGFKENFFKNYEFYYVLRSEYNKNLSKNNYIQAARFIFLIHTNYNGIYRVNTNGNYNVPIGRKNPKLPDLDHLRLISLKLQGKGIERMHYSKILNLVSKNDFIYLDPPYPPVNWNNHLKQYTAKRFSKMDHEALVEFANKLNYKGCMVMISCPDIELIRDYYRGWNQIKLNIKRGISYLNEKKEMDELIIKNY